MSDKSKVIAVIASGAGTGKPSVYPGLSRRAWLGREKRPLGDLFSLTNFGVKTSSGGSNAVSALRPRTPSKTVCPMFSKVDQHFIQMKTNPNSVPEMCRF